MHSYLNLLCHRMTDVSKMCGYVTYVTNMLCCHCWMFSLSDALPMQSYPSKVWILCQHGRADLCAAQLICLVVSYRSMLLHEIGGILWLYHLEDVDFIVVECSFYYLNMV